ncbi:hypothetical protein WN51_09039 [Melipona quadrifasciata]|uniref:Uncharacterized protein n=1 Tax=Melipona quadrifasciata TaxID=166423 RepID=A0A0N1ISZ5_9HYME|nr:hypothetical protein WN51_09039 [Melipona quadrifasciata]
MSTCEFCEVWVPHLLTETGLMNRVSTCDLLLQRHERDPSFQRGSSLETRLGFYNKMCIENALGPRKIDRYSLWGEI